jgi:hypothetical protein
MTHINKRSTRSLLKITLTNMKMILRNKKRKQQRPIVWLKRLKKERPRSKLSERGSLMRRKRGLSTRSSKPKRKRDKKKRLLPRLKLIVLNTKKNKRD